MASFETGMLDPGRWKGSWITDSRDIALKPAPYFRKEINDQKTRKDRIAYIAAGGLYELYLNGKRVGDHQLDPMYTRYDRRNLYVTYDVSSQISKSQNALGVFWETAGTITNPRPSGFFIMPTGGRDQDFV